MKSSSIKSTSPVFLIVVAALISSGCAALFGWDIHAPGILSARFLDEIQPVNQRIALYFEPELASFISTDKGGRFADPQTYHVGEALTPMLVEGFQQGFHEFILMETRPTPEIMRQYAIPHLAVVRVNDFGNRVTLKGQAIALITETAVLDQELNLLGKFESTGVSDAQKIFAKKGGPQVNLNAAIENNVKAIIEHIQDSLQTNAWQKQTA